tara:strand:+ start:49945 stop:50094 length:150 start_codon:yes stop_codon:yes gene_type:complete
MTIEIGLYTGIMLGVRSFEPTEVNPVWEFQIFIPFIYIAFMSSPIEEEE